MTTGEIISICNIVASVLMGIGLFYVGSKARKIDKLEEAIEKKAEMLVAAQFNVLGAEFKMMVNELSNIVRQMDRRLEKGDEKFEEHAEAQHQIELRMTEKYATKQELAAFAERLRQLEIDLSKFQSAMQRKAGLTHA